MDKTIALVVSASVILVAAVITIAFGSGGLSDVQNSNDNIRDQGCDYQIQQVRDNPDLADSLSPECRQQFERSQDEGRFVGNVVSQLS